MLDGEWEDDGVDMLKNHVGEDRAEAWGVIDMSACPAKQIAGELAVLYTRRPALTCSAGDATDLVGDEGLLRRAGLWTKMKELQRYCWFLRDFFLRVDVNVKTRQLQFRLVSPHNVTATSSGDEPDRPLSIRELRLREIDEELCWTWDVLDISDEENPVYRVIKYDHKAPKAERETDITVAALGGEFSGKAYPYRLASGRPILPYVMYHARDTGKLWNSWDGVEVMIGSLNAAVYWTMAGHAAKDASGRTVIVAGAEVQGVETKRSKESGHPIRSLTLEPGTMVFLEPVGNNTITVQEVGPGAQVVDLEEFANRYERRIAVMAGINPSDIQRMGGDARSGYAIAISNQGKRTAQEEQVELYRRYDLELLEVAAVIANRLLGMDVPETGYGIEYAPIPKTPEEQSAEREEIDFDLRNNVIAPWQVVKRRRPGLTDEEAQIIFASNSSEKSAVLAAEKASDTAMNGAQIAAATNIGQLVELGEISRNQAMVILKRAYAMDDAEIRKFVA